MRYGQMAAARGDDVLPSLPARPLALLVEMLAATDDSMESACVALGINGRQYRAWRLGEIERVGLATADRVLTRSGRHWWDVWDPVEFPEVAEVMEAA